MVKVSMRMARTMVWWLATFFFVNNVAAKGVSPYLPEKMSPLLEREVARLATVAGMPQLTRPYSLAVISEYLDRIRDTHPTLHSRLSQALKPYLYRFNVTHIRATVGYSEEAHPAANARGNDIDRRAQVTLRGQWEWGRYAALYFGGDYAYYGDVEENSTRRDEQSVSTPTGTMLSFGAHWAQLDIGYRDLWLSPFQGASQLVSTHAATMPSITLSNNLPLEFFGVGIHYQGTLAQMSRQPTLFNDEFSDEDPPLMAVAHLTLQPSDWWSIGATRVFQFAGGERPRSLRLLARAFFDPRGSDNDASVDEESGNQLAAIASQVHFDGRMPFTFSVELAGEDASNSKQYQLGNSALTAGLFFPYFISDDISLALEYAEWQNAWYSNNVYQDGFVNEGYVIGHWAMQPQREGDFSQDGESLYADLQWQLAGDQVVGLLYRSSDHAASTGLRSSWETEVRYTMPQGQHALSVAWLGGRDALGNDFQRVSLAWEW